MKNSEQNQSRQILKRPKPKKDPKHLQRVRELGCIICQSPANAHHIRAGNGLSQKASDYETIPLCHFHHQGKEGIHTVGTRVWQMRFGTEIDLLEKTRRLLND